MGETLTLELDVLCVERLRSPEIGIALQNCMGINLQNFVSTWEGWHGPLEEGLHRFRIQIPEVALYPGTYALTPWITRVGNPVDDQVDHALVFNVIEADVTGHRPYFERWNRTNCEVYWPSSWSHTAHTGNPERSNGQRAAGSTSIERSSRPD